MFRHHIILAGILFLATNILAAQTISFDPLRKGDIIPNIPLTIYKNNEVQKIRLYDLNKKLIILDFWSTSCSSCILQMSHLQKLQQDFKQDIQVIVVTKNTKQEIDRLKERIRGHISPEISYAFDYLSFITSDSILSIIFPHEGFPIHVWIDSSKKLKAITYSTTTTNENVQNFLKGDKIKLAEQGLRNIDRSNPISWLDSDTGYIDQLKYYSFIFSRIEHKGGYDRQVSPSFDSVSGKVTAFNIVNSPIPDLYKLAYFKYKHPNIGIPDSKIFLETKDKNRFYAPKNETEYLNWADSNLYSYAIKVTPEDADSIYTLMKLELDKFFKLKSKIEYRKVKCMVLKQTKLLIRSVSNIDKNELAVDSTGSWMVLQHQPIALLASRIESLINYYDAYQPFFNETDFDQNIDIVLPWSSELKDISLNQIRKSLNLYGFDLREEYKTIKMIVLSDEK